MATNNAINNLLFPNLTSVNTGTVLTSAAYGTEVICTGASSYALTLPTVTSNANKFIDIFSQTTSNALVTITPASGTIAGQATLIIGTGDGVRIMNDGTNWWVLNCWLQPANFLVNLSTNQSIPNNAVTKAQLNTEIFDIGGFYDNSVNYRYTPKLPGKYLFISNINFATVAAAQTQANDIQKNGVLENQSFAAVPSSASISINNSYYVQMNGSTDYTELFVFQNSGGALNLEATSVGATTKFEGTRVSLF